MSLNPGTQLKSYEILGRVGSGGMGEVYRAKDLKLGRNVALKVLRPEYATDSNRIRRFETEARSASALNHPNIVTIHEIAQHASILFMVMEFIEGETLRKIISNSPLTIDRILPIATQIADGLSKAHAAGILHRDLKPENVMITNDGFVKILDFGLAKLIPDPKEEDSQLDTRTEAVTREGVILGTVPYMSPEQASGRAVDYRTDQFSFGLILYQMATGKLPFLRETTPQTLAAIIQDIPTPITTMNRNIPQGFSLIVQRCLNKTPAERYERTNDLAAELKNILTTQPASEPQAIQSLAVLPFANMNKDPEQEYFSDGMTEALITDLAKIGSIKVISRTSIMRYKDTDKLLPEIARELNVQGIVEGSVLRAEGRVRITAQLIEAATDQHLWAESYDRDLRDILSLQSEVARTIAREIQVKLTPQEEKLLVGKTVDPEAHEAYLKGRYHFNKWSQNDLKLAIRYFKKAFQYDTNMATAYAGLANAHLINAYLGYAEPVEELKKAHKATARALDLDPMLAEAHMHEAYVDVFLNRDLPKGESGLQRAIELNPNYADAFARYGLFHTAWKHYGPAMEMIERAVELDPFSITVQTAIGMALTHARRYEEATVELHKVLKMDPDNPQAHFFLASIFKRTGKKEECAQEWIKTLDQGGGFLARRMMKAYKRYGLEKSLLKIAQWMKVIYYVTRIIRHIPLIPHTYFSPIIIAMTYAEAGDTNKPLTWLEKAYRGYDPQIYTLHAPIWDDIREKSQFQSLVDRVFPETSRPAGSG